MPTRELEAYIDALPAIEAGRSLVAAEQIAVGVGRLPAEAHRAAVASWRRAIGRSARQPASREELVAAARAHGIGFRRTVVPRAADG